MTDVADARLRRIRKLLAQAEDPACTSAEAEAFTAKATSLIAAYGIDEALLEARHERAGAIADLVLDVPTPYSREKASLAAEIADPLGCRLVLRQQRGYDGTTMSLHIFGSEGALRSLQLLYTSLLLQGSRDLARTPIPPRQHTAAYRRTWWLGFSGAIGRRLREAHEEKIAEAEEQFGRQGTSSAVVLADRAALTERAVQEAYPRVQASASRRLSGSGSMDGWLSGQRAELGGGTALGGRSA